MQESFPGYSREVYTLGKSPSTVLSKALTPRQSCPCSSSVSHSVRPLPIAIRPSRADAAREGPLLWAPAGEVSGRRALYIITFTLFTIFNGVCCASQNLTTLIVMRLLSGIAGAAPLSNSGTSCSGKLVADAVLMAGVGGTVADLFNADERGIGMVVFSAAPFMGPALGPIVRLSAS